MSVQIPTKQEVYDYLMKHHPEKYEGLTEDEIKIYDTGSVRVRGRFAPGFSGKPQGRKKKQPIPKGSPDLSPEEIKKFGKDAKKALEHMLETAGSRKEVKEISKILISYQSPKLANVESRSFEQKTIEIKWVDDSKDLIDITPEDYKLQEEAAKKLLSKEIDNEHIESDKSLVRAEAHTEGSSEESTDN